MQAEDGPIDAPKSAAEVRQTPYNLPEGYVWSTCDLNEDSIAHEVRCIVRNAAVQQIAPMLCMGYHLTAHRQPHEVAKLFCTGSTTFGMHHEHVICTAACGDIACMLQQLCH